MSVRFLHNWSIVGMAGVFPVYLLSLAFVDFDASRCFAACLAWAFFYAGYRCNN